MLIFFLIASFLRNSLLWFMIKIFSTEWVSLCVFHPFKVVLIATWKYLQVWTKNIWFYIELTFIRDIFKDMIMCRFLYCWIISSLSLLIINIFKTSRSFCRTLRSFYLFVQGSFYWGCLTSKLATLVQPRWSSFSLVFFSRKMISHNFVSFNR